MRQHAGGPDDQQRVAECLNFVVAGKQAVCGLVNARNSRGFMTGPQPFAYDGEQAYLIVFNPGPANFTSLDANSLIAAMGGRLKSYNRLCR